MLLSALPVLAVFGARAFQKPWVPECPAYRQKGSPRARVIVVEFSDFQCPGCAAAVEPVKQILALYGADVRVLFKHRPWDRIHPKALEAAAAAECAGQQGKFWEFHDLLYLKQREWVEAADTGDRFLSYAREIGLEVSSFDRCRTSPESLGEVRADARQAEDLWIHSTPTFIINGRRLVGGMQLRTVGLREIERILRSK